MSKLLEFFNDMRDNGYGLAEIAAQLGTSAIAEPVAGFAAMYDPANGADAIREGMTYQPRSEAAKMYQQGASNVVGQAIKPVMPVIDAWQRGVDIAGRYSPMAGAALQTVPTALGVALGAKPALEQGRQLSNSLGSMQGRMVANANAPRTLNTGFRGQRGAVGTQRPLTEFEQAHLTAQRNAALPVNQGGLGLHPDNTAMDRARAMGWVDDAYHGTSADFPEFSLGGYGVHGNVGGTGVYLGVPDTASSYAQSASSMTGNAPHVMPLLTRGKLLDTSSEAPLNNNLIDNYINENLFDGDKARIALDAGGKRVTKSFENIEDAKDFFWNQKKNWEYFSGFDRTLPQADMIDGKAVVSYVDFNAPVSLNGLPIKEVHGALRRAGGGTMTDVLKNIGYDGTKSARETVIFDPKNIRSRFAAFDPFNRDSANLLAQYGAIAPTTALGAYMYNEKRKKSQGNQ